MAASGYTPISLYYSTTAAAAPVAGNLTNGELAINITDGKLYYKDNTGTVKVIAGAGGAGIAGGSNTQVQYNSSGSLAGSANMTFDGTTLTVNGLATTGTVTVGDASGDALTINSSAVSIPNGLNFDSNTFVIDATNNNVGIGTSSPSSYQFNGAAQLVIANTSGNATFSIASSSTGIGYIAFADGTTGTDRYAGNIRYDHTTNLMAFATNGGSDALKIDSSGNLGLGVTPSAWGSSYKAVELAAGSLGSNTGGTATYLTQNTYFNGSNWIYKTTAAANLYSIESGQHRWHYAASGTAGTTATLTQAMTLDASGNLLVGTTSSAYSSSNRGVIEVNGSSDSLFALKRNNTNNFYIQNEASAVYLNNTSTTTPIIFNLNGAERMRITSTGNVGIGTSSPAGKLDVAQGNSYVSTFLNSTGAYALYFNKSRGTTVGTNTIVASGDTLGGTIFNGADGTGYIEAAKIIAQVDGTPGTNDMPGRLLFYTTADGAASGTERMRLDSSGNLGLGVTPSAWGAPLKGFDIGAVGGLAAGTTSADGVTLARNGFWNGSSWIYKNTSAASHYEQTGGQHRWYTAPSGTAGNAITFTQAMTLNASGQLSVGSTSAGTNAIVDITSTSNSDAVFPLQVYSNNRAASLSMSYGAISASSNLVLYSSGTSNYAILNTSGNLGLGVSPAAWESGAKVIQMSSAGAGGTSGNYGSIWARADTIRLINAAYFDSGSYRYAVTGVAPNMLSMSNDGAFYFTKAASGTAGNSFSFTNQMVLDASGYLLLTSATPRIQLIPSTSTNNALIQFQNTGGNVYVGTDSSAGGLTAPYALNLYHSGAYPIVFTTNSSERMRIDSSGNLLVGTTTPTNNLRLNAKLAVVATGTSSYGGANFTTYSGTTAVSGSFLDFNRSRGTVDGSMTIVANNDTLGYLVFRGSDGTNFVNSAQIQADVDGTPGSNDMPGRLMFLTTADGASSPTERMRIDSSGNVLFAKAVRATITTDNDLSFDMNAASNFKCTPTAGGALTFTNITSGQTGNIILVNGANYAITAAATTKVSSTCLATISATGTYWLSYYSDGTNVYVANTGALA